MMFLDKLNSYSSIIMDTFKIYDRSPSEMVNDDDIARQYHRGKSFTDFLPFVEYLPDSRMFLLEDCRSVGAAFEFRTLNVEGFPLQSKAKIRDQLMNALNDSIPRIPDNPWVLECFFSNTYSLGSAIEDICNFNRKNLHNDPLKEAFNNLNRKHLEGVAGEKGIFVDTQVTGMKFGGKETVGRLFLYRRRGNDKKTDESPITELSIVRDKVLSSLKSAELDVKIMDGQSFYEWSFRWFNPNPSVTNGDTEKALKLFPYPGDEEQLIGRDFSAAMSLKPPVSDVKNGTWDFDGIKHKYLSVEMVRRAPNIGVISAPIKGKSLFDTMPSGAMFTMKIIFVDKDSIDKDIVTIEKKSVGDGALAIEAKAEADEAKTIIARGGTLLPIEMGFFVKGSDEDELRAVKNEIVTVGSNASLQVIDDANDDYACDSYLRMMPCSYKWSLNSQRNRSIKLSLQHIANYMPVLGRGRGTGTPVQIQFNRGGEPMFYDKIRDRNANSHCVMIGSTGAGKSAKMVEEVMSYVAQYNARVFVIEKGESFKLLMNYMAGMGKTVSSMKLTRGSGAVIPPFANAYRALAAEDDVLEEMINNPVDVIADVLHEVSEAVDASKPIDKALDGVQAGLDEAEEKDYLGEMELITRIIVTGGDAERNKNISPSDQSFIRRAILNAAKRCQDEGKPHPLITDVADEMKLLIETDTQMRETHKEKAYDMGEAMMGFTKGLAGKLFNQYGALWEEKDLTHIDLGDVTRDGKSAELAVAYASILNSINDIAEREQYSGRPIIVVTDEGHNIVSKSSKASPILVPAVVKIVKMWRKLNAWFWIATQNVGDFSDDAAAILKLCEWWEVLTVEAGEDDEIARFKKLTDEQSAILSSVTKENRKYTEGFVMCRNKQLNNQIFRNIPPSLVLCLAMSDPEEKAERKVLMDKFGVDENGSVDIMAANLDRARGFVEPA